jgi:hypothetical protein
MNIFNRHTKKYLKLPSEEIEYEFIKDGGQLPSEEIEYEFIKDGGQLPSEEIEYKKIYLKVDEQLTAEHINEAFYYNLKFKESMIDVKKDGLNLEYVHDQTSGICKIAVQNNPHALKFVKNQTREICILALNSSLKSYRNPVHIFAHIKDDNLRDEIYETNKNLIRNQLNNQLIRL